jgi:hypothetical protein
MIDSNNSNPLDNNNLSNFDGQNLQQYTGQDGSEYVINTTNGDAFISQRGCARTLECNESTIRYYKEKGLFTTVTAQILTPDGKRTAQLISSKGFFKLAQIIKPEMAEKMEEGGSKMFLYGLAGYKIKLSEPSPVSEYAQTLRNINYAQAYIKLETAKINVEQFPGVKRMLEYLQVEKENKQQIPPFSLFAYLTEEDCLDFLSKKQINAFNKRVASLYRIYYQKHPQRAQCALTGKRANHYTEEDLVIIEQAFDTLDVVG